MCLKTVIKNTKNIKYSKGIKNVQKITPKYFLYFKCNLIFDDLTHYT